MDEKVFDEFSDEDLNEGLVWLIDSHISRYWLADFLAVHQ